MIGKRRACRVCSCWFCRLKGGFALVSTPRLKVLNLEKARVMWKLLRGGKLVLNLYSKLVLRLPG